MVNIKTPALALSALLSVAASNVAAQSVGVSTPAADAAATAVPVPVVPSTAPTPPPTADPTVGPTPPPTADPSVAPTTPPTADPTVAPTMPPAPAAPVDEEPLPRSVPSLRSVTPTAGANEQPPSATGTSPSASTTAVLPAQETPPSNPALASTTPAAATQLAPVASGAAAKPTGNANTTTSSMPATGNGAGKGTNPLVIKGYRFFDSVTGEYFGPRGVNYYPRPNSGPLNLNNLDFFSEQYGHIWKRDLIHFVALNANAIRLYAVDPEQNHDEFMCAMQAAGIYVLVDLGSSCQGCEITTDEAPACYPASYKLRGEKIIDNFAKYTNVLGFSGGNEINHRTGGNPPQWNAPCQKKFVRDMRAYIAGCPSMRKIPVGLVMADTHREENAKYYNCRTDPKDQLENAEWYGINVYVHCIDEANPKKSAGFNMLRDSFKSYKYSIPTILTEFGCLSEGFPKVGDYHAQRTFHQAKFMNSPDYSEYLQGGFVFEYSTENINSMGTSAYPFTKYGPQNYGLGYLTPENCEDAIVDGEVPKPCDFERFPCFGSLSTVYKETDTSAEPTLDSFKVAEDRTQPSTCPADFPKLSEFKWEGDSAKVHACPTDTSFQCPNVLLNKITKAPTAKKPKTTAQSSGSSDIGTDMGGSGGFGVDAASMEDAGSEVEEGSNYGDLDTEDDDTEDLTTIEEDSGTETGLPVGDTEADPQDSTGDAQDTIGAAGQDGGSLAGGATSSTSSAASTASTQVALSSAFLIITVATIAAAIL